MAEEPTNAPAAGLVVLEPETWLGKTFPLAPHLEPTVDISTGNWVVLLFHHDFPDCQKALPIYDAIAASQGNATRVLLIEVPPFGEEPMRASAAALARLSSDAEWFVQTPTEIRVEGGRVVQAKHVVADDQPESQQP